MKRLGGLKKIAIRVDERRNGCSTQHRTPTVILPLGIERQVNADSDSGMSLEHLHCLLVPGSGKHHRHRNWKPGLDEFFETHVHAVTHPGVVTADDQVDLLGIVGMFRCVGLTDSTSR